MKTNSARLRAVLIALAILLAVGVTVYAAANYGSREDPLITKSYLDSVVQPELEKELEIRLEAALSEAEFNNAGGDFVLLTLQNGQRVTGEVGTELLPRFGSVRAYAYDSADVALVDTTDAAAVMNGSTLSANHLYMITIKGNGFTAAADNTKVLIAGEYTVN